MQNLLVLLLLLASSAARAGAMTGGSTEVTQIANNVQLIMAYSQQVEQYRLQLQEYQLQLKHLQQNSSGAMNGNTSHIIQGVGSIMSAQNSIGGTLAQIDANFARKYGNAVAGSYSEKFRTWTDTSMGTLGASLRAAGLHRDAYATDADALQALYNRSQSSAGTVAAIQQLSALTTMQIQQSQKLGDLMASQNMAATTWMASQTSKEQEAQTTKENLAAPFQAQMPEIQAAKIINWNSTLKLQK